MSKYSYHETQRTTTIPRWYEKNPNIDTSTITKTFLGIVRDSRDPQGMGRLLVWIPELTGDPDVPKNWFICAYASPFAGSSFFDVGQFTDAHGSNAIETIQSRAGPNGANRTPTKQKSQLSGRQSYGMWFVPPDIGNEVLVTFINGDPGFGVWFGCLFPQDMTHMIPGIASNRIAAGQGDDITTDEIGPVLETDLSVERIENRGDVPQRRVFKPLRDGLKLFQGLNDDSIRGQSSSSAQREARRSETPLPSEVFGLLTPNGNHFVLDDDPENEFIRFRTKSGAQLLINETNGLIYAITKDGKTWIELSNEGNVDVYASLNISFHAEQGNINFRAGQDVNIHAARDFNMRSDRDFKIASLNDIDIKGTGDIKIQIDGEMHQKSGSIFRQTAGGNFDIQVDGDYREEANNVFMNSGGVSAASSAKFPNTAAPAGPSVQSTTGDWNVGEPYEKGTNIVPRVPQHEPYSEHDYISTDDVFVPGPILSYNNESRVKPTNTPVDLTMSSGATPTGDPIQPDENTTSPVRPGTTPLPTNGVCGLTTEETQSLMDAIGFRESGGRTNIENTLGFVGKYQFGTAALEDVGLIKPGTYNTATNQGIDAQSVLNNSNNWTIDGGKETFLNNQQLQEESMLRLMARNCSILTNSGTIAANTSKQERAGLLTASHIGGAGGAQALLQGKNRADAYGGSTSEYFQLGSTVLQDLEREAAEAALIS